MKPYSRLRSEVEAELSEWLDDLEESEGPLFFSEDRYTTSPITKSWFLDLLTGKVLSVLYSYMDEDNVDELPEEAE